MQEYSIALGQNGRIVIPAGIRRKMDLKQGQRLLMRLEGDQIILQKTTDIIGKLQQRFSGIPTSLSEELIAERREEAEREKHDS